MDFKEYVMEDSENNIIRKIYHNNMEELQMMNQSKEYVQISKKIKKLEKILLKEFTEEKVEKYIEYTNEKISIEAESQFELGFKTAVKIILQAVIIPRLSRGLFTHNA